MGKSVIFEPKKTERVAQFFIKHGLALVHQFNGTPIRAATSS